MIRPADHQPTTHAQGVVSILLELAEIDQRIILLTADIGFIASTICRPFSRPFLSVGVAEQSMMRTATGLANSDFIPFVYPIVPFAVLRQLEFIRNIGKPGTHVDHLASHTRRAFVVLPSHTTGRMKPIEMHPTPCPISGEEGDATEIYPANFNAASLSPAIFSARRVPDRIHFRIVCSNRSGLVRSDPVADQVLIYDLYKQSSFDYAQSSTQRW